MATFGGKTLAVVGLWATYPAEPVNGLMVTDRVLPFLFREEDAGAPRLVHPPKALRGVRDARERAEQAVGLPEMQAYLPWLTESEYEPLARARDPYAHPVSALRRILVETRLHHDLATRAVRGQNPDLTVVYFQGTDSIGHVYAPYAPPRQLSVPEAEYERYHAVPEVYFRHIDGLLGEYRRLAEVSKGVLMLASDHGFRWGEGRPERLSSVAHTTAAEWHRREGVYLLWGEGIAASPGHPERGSVEQVAPTILTLLGLPPRKDGGPLPGMPASGREPADYAAHYRRPAPVAAAASKADADALEKLRALGYIGGGGGGGGGGARPPGSTRTAGSYANESLILRLQGRRAEAIRAAETALALDSGHASALWCLSDVLQAEAGARDRSDRLLVQAFARGLPGGPRYLAARALAYQRSGEPARGARLLSAAVEARPGDAEAWRLRGRYAIDRGDCAAGRRDFERAVRLAPADPASHAGLGLARLCGGDETGARVSFDRAGASAGEARRILASAALARGDLAAAEREAKKATGSPETDLAAVMILAQVELRRSRPVEALALLDRAEARRVSAGTGPAVSLALLRGDALARLGRAKEAEAAFREEIRRFPAGTAAYSRLSSLLAKLGRAPEIGPLLDAMYAASPRRDTAQLAARTAASIGDQEAAQRWRERAQLPVGDVVPP
jgi:tetratricopeptide (TPR) repeat protein